jgi:PKD repeat protein
METSGFFKGISPGLDGFNMVLKKISILFTAVLLIQFSACAEEAKQTHETKPEGAVAKAESHFGKAPLLVTFNGKSSFFPPGGTLSYSWDFDDGSVSDGAVTQHTFQSPGTYMVTLTVTTSAGLKDVTTVVIIVN